jgi:CubicO group peptidase (beta-lactamase class C family)
MTYQRIFLLWLTSLLLLSAVYAGGLAAPDSSLIAREVRVKTFLGEDLEFERYIFPPGRFPSVRWKRPATVEQLVDEIPLSVEFFDRSGTRVDRADKQGRYGAVVHGKTSDGFTVVRYVTLYCCPAEMDDYSPNVPLSVEPLADFGVSKDQWQSYRDNLRRYSFGSLLTSPKHDPDAAIFLAGLSELNPDGGRLETPRLLDRNWWIQFKRQRDGENHSPLSLSVERIGDNRSPKAKQEKPVSSTYGNGDIQRIREICAAWAESAHEPMVALVLHDGVPVIHEAFGKRSDGTAMTTSIPTWMASITKLMTGVLVMQFVDRGLLNLDAPLDQYLPELGSSKPCLITLRHCLTHTAGLSWTGEWASDWNPSMENQIAQALPFIEPGRAFKYHRAGYAMAGKVLERLSGESVPALFDRLILTPLRMDHAYADNTYGGLYATAADLGRFGQMLLDRGRASQYQILSETAFAKLLPAPLCFGRNDLNKSWGIGCAPLGGHGLSDATFGHEAASGAILRIDPDRHLVVVVGRDNVGPDYRQYERFLDRFLNAVGFPWEHPGNRE